MKVYERRNLRLAIVDDNKRLATALVDLVTFPPGDDTRISGLEMHCRSAAAHRPVAFDLLSVDINFQDDDGDPMRPSKDSMTAPSGPAADPKIMTASGLYHGMLLLGRRQAVVHGNRLPLAWEIRSAAPSEFDSRPALLADARRGYALLRSLLASPRDGESLEECVRREHAEAFGSTLDDGSLLDILRDDLLRQQSSYGLVPDVLEKLLPRWRSLFLRAVRNRDLIVDIDELALQEEALRSRRIASVRAKDPMAQALNIPIVSPGGATMEGIRLVSIMADLVADGSLDLLQRTRALGTENVEQQSVLDWLVTLRTAAAHSWLFAASTTVRSFEEAARGIDDKTAPESVAKLWRRYSKSPSTRFFLYILMRTRLWIRPSRDGERSNPSNRDLAKAYRLPSHDRVFLRDIARCRLLIRREGNIEVGMGAEELALALHDALSVGKGALVEQGLWTQGLQQALYSYCTADRDSFGLGYDDGFVRRVAPGLVRA
jgi:hypothetical protein